MDGSAAKTGITPADICHDDVPHTYGYWGYLWLQLRVGLRCRYCHTVKRMTHTEMYGAFCFGLGGVFAYILLVVILVIALVTGDCTLTGASAWDAAPAMASTALLLSLSIFPYYFVYRKSVNSILSRKPALGSGRE